MNDRIAELERIAAARAAEVLDDAGAQRNEQLETDVDVDPAGRRLQAAEEILREAREITAADSVPVTDDGDLRAKLSESMTALYEGDQDRAVEVLAEAVKPNVQAIAAEVLVQADRQAGIERLKRHHPEILKDPYLAAMADSHYFAARRAGKGEGEALDEAGDKTIEHLRRAAAGMGIDVQDAGEPAAVDEPNASSVIAAMAAGRPSHSVG